MMSPEEFRQQRLENFYGFARAELETWAPIAVKWKLYLDGFANRCTLCDQCIWFTHDMHGEQYMYSTEEILALIIAHVRQVHDQVAVNE